MSGEIINFLFNGTLNGAVFSLIALGYSLVYGVGHLMNLAHGAYFMITGYMLLWFQQFTPGLPLFNALLILLIITVIGGLTYILLIKPLQDTNVGVVLVTFGLAFFLEQLALIISGTTSYAINNYLIVSGVTEIFGYSMINQYIFLIVISLLIVSSFALFINKSKLGKSIRAVSQDREAATLMGINANRILLYTVMISAFLAGIAAILYLPAAAINGPSMGWTFLTNSFAVVILGGMGSLVGSVVGAYIVGFVTSYTNLFIPNGPSWAHLIPIIVIVIMLLIRPQGLFGKKEVR
ncbi:MAG: branched-chain amino acid ABC transporter permease [Promethearchaeota archaeon]|jgi:branched-chain amino acid transport system permease protein